MSSCGSCGAYTSREPLCKLCNDEDCAETDRLLKQNEELTKENARLREELAQARRCQRGHRCYRQLESRWPVTIYEEETVTLDEVTSIHATDQAVLCLIDSRKVWVPQSVIHDDSEVFEAGQSGKLVILRWWAVREGLG